MKWLIEFVNKQEALFEKGGKFEKLYPLYEGMQTFLFSAKGKTKTGAHVRDSIDTKRVMSIVIVALIPCLLFGIYNTGYQALKVAGMPLEVLPIIIEGLKVVVPLLIVSYGVGLGIEFFACILRGHEINEGFLVTGILYTLILPPTIPLWQAAVGIAFAVIIGKEVFGGSGRNFLNPALTGRIFLFFAFPQNLSGNVWTAMVVAKDKLVDGFTGATPLSIAAESGVGTPLQQTLVDAGFGLKELYIGLIPGSIGETSVWCVLLGAIFLLITGVGSWRTMLGCLLGAVGMTLILNIFAGPNSLPFLTLTPAWQLGMGSFAFACVFMATDPVSSPALETSRFIYGLLIGMLGIIVRVINPAYPEGWMLAIILMNVFAPLIDHYVLERKLKKRMPNVI